MIRVIQDSTRHELGLAEGTPVTERTGELAGHPCRSVLWSLPEGKAELLLMRRGRTFYGMILHGSDLARRQAADMFSLLGPDGADVRPASPPR